MKTILNISLALILFYSNLFAQVSNGGIAPSIKYKSKYDESKIVVLEKIDLSKIEKQDEENSKNGTPLKYAQSIKVNLNPENSGYWEQMPNGKRIWRLKIKAEGAKAIGVYYNNFVIPEGGELYLYNETQKQRLGAYTFYNNKPQGTFANELVNGETVTIEYVESQTSPFKPEINISEISYAFREVNFLNEKFNDSQSCQNNVNCSPIGDNWQDEKRGVVRISIKIGADYFWCSGSVINNTKQDCLPYVLTADHCAEGATETDLQYWVFYFNYESADCENPTTEPASKTMTGAFYKANGGDGGAAGSDFYLVMLETYPAEDLNVYYNGWNRSTTATAGGVGIHHPSGDIKKISEYTVTPTSSTWGSVSGSHWRMKWSNGVTETGSSGSPLFDNNGRIIGDLTGGGSMCTNLTAYDYYGKFSYSWISNGTTSDKQLKPWLDPISTGAFSLDGINQNCANLLPVAKFTESATTINKGESIDFTDASEGLPNWWKWTFQGGTPSLVFAQNRTVKYNNAGIYDVTLFIRNGYGADTLVKTDRIIVLDTTPLDASFTSNKDSIFEGETIDFTSTSLGSPFFYEWTFEGAIPSTSTEKNPTNIKYNIAGKYSVKLKISTTVGADSIIITDFITVLKTDLKAMFSATKTTIKIGETINFTNQSEGNPTIFQWTFAGANPNTSVDENPTNISYDQVGKYAVKLEISNIYNETNNLEISDYITVEDTANYTPINKIKNLKIYPNPIKNEINIDYSKTEIQIDNIKILNELGQEVMKFKVDNIDKNLKYNIRNLENGIYFLNINTINNSYIEKISIINNK